MGIFGKKEIIIHAPFDGTIKPLSKLKDKTFAQKILGDGIAITPTSNVAYSPLSKGKILNAFHTGHAFGLSTGKGPEVLVHIGMDTVMLKGKGFDVKAKDGDSVNTDSVLVKIDLKEISKKAPSMDTPVIITNDSIGNYKIELIKKSGKILAKEPIFKLIKK